MNVPVTSGPNSAVRRSFARKGVALGSAAVVAGGATTALLAAFAIPASATTLTVDSTGDGAADPSHCTNGTIGDCTLRDALDAAADGDTITFDGSLTGTISLSAGQLLVAKNVTIVGPGAASLAVDAGGASRVFYLQAGATGDIVMSGLTISGGNVTGDGGGILVKNAGDSSFDSVVVTGNTATGNGGGIVFPYDGRDHNQSIANSKIFANASGTNGGGVYFGAVLSNSFTQTVSASTIEGNTAAERGGGIYLQEDYAPGFIVDSTISGNSAPLGGGVFLNSSPLTIANSTLTLNSAGDGGGINASGNSPRLTVLMSTITDNSAGTSGGGIRLSDTLNFPTTVTGSIVSGNSAGSAGSHDIFSGGSATLNGDSDLFGVVSVSADNTTNVITSTSPGLGPLADNGGPTRTMSLLAGSPALNAGPATVPVFAGNQFDQRGAGYPRVVLGAVDIGAYEVSTPPPAPTTTSTTVSPSDPVVPAFTG